MCSLTMVIANNYFSDLVFVGSEGTRFRSISNKTSNFMRAIIACVETIDLGFRNSRGFSQLIGTMNEGDIEYFLEYLPAFVLPY